MRVRKLDANDDMSFGHGQLDYYNNIPSAPALAVRMRLELYQGEWFLNTSDGTPWFTEILGKYTLSTRDAVLQERVLQTPGITAINTYSSIVQSNVRSFSATFTVTTAYGVSDTISV